MQANTKIWASASGVCIASAVVIGAVLGTSGSSPTHQQPVGNAQSVTATIGATTATSPGPTTPVTVSAPASPTLTPAASTSTVAVAPPKQAAPRQQQQQQEAPVTDQTTTSATPPADPPPAGKPAPGMPGATVDDGGVTRAPSLGVPSQHPTEPPVPQQDQQGQGD